MGDTFGAGLKLRNKITVISLESLSWWLRLVRAQASLGSRLIAEGGLKAASA